MPNSLDPSQIIEVIRESFIDKMEENTVDGVYLFGSIVNNEGRMFNQEYGDIDIVVVVHENSRELGNRIDLLNQIRSESSNTEHKILRFINRSNVDDCIISKVIATDLEINYAIHKSGQTELFSGRRFVDILNPDSGSNSLSEIMHEPAFYNKNRDIISTIQFCQSVRSEYVAVSANWNYKIPDSIMLREPIPKPIMRQAAILGCYLKEEDVSYREDISFGISYMMELIEKYKETGPGFRNQVDRIRERSTGRVDTNNYGLMASDHLFLSEVLFEEARDNIGRSTSDDLWAISQSMLSNSQKR